MMEKNYVKGNKQKVSLKQRIRSNIFGALSVAVAVAGLFSPSTFAVTQQSVTSDTNVLKVTPVRTDVQIAAGETKTVPITVTNLTGSDVNISAIENDFVAGDEKGTPALILDANEFAPTHSLKRFMVPIGDVIVPAKQGKTINVTITVPKTAQAGGYFGALRFAPSSPDGGAQVNLSASVASLILLTVPGPVQEKMSLTNFEVQQDGKNSNYFSTPSNLNVYARFENKGNVQEGPFGKVSVTSGKNVVYSADFNVDEPRDVVLPDSARQWNIPLKNVGTFGHYTVQATFTYGQDNKTIEVSRTFWVVPTWLLIVAAAVLLIVIALIVVGIMVLRRNRRRRRLYGRRKKSAGNLRY